MERPTSRGLSVRGKSGCSCGYSSQSFIQSFGATPPEIMERMLRASHRVTAFVTNILLAFRMEHTVLYK